MRRTANLLIFLCFFASAHVFAGPKDKEAEALEALESYATVHLKPQLSSAEEAKAEQTLQNINVENKSGALARLLLLGNMRPLYKNLHQMVSRLGVPHDPSNYEIVISLNPDPNAAVYVREDRIILTIGLLAAAPDMDFLAGVVAHEMTHNNSSFDIKLPGNLELDDVLRQAGAYSKLDKSQREELRSDLGAVDRLIRAGYNPWSYYESEKYLDRYIRKISTMRLTKLFYGLAFGRSFAYDSTHPISEVRTAAVKLYIEHRSYGEDLSKLVGKREPLPFSQKILRARAALLSPFNSVWSERAIKGMLVYQAFKFAGIFSAETWLRAFSYVQPLFDKIPDFKTPIQDAFDRARYSDAADSFAWLSGKLITYGLPVMGAAGVYSAGRFIYNEGFAPLRQLRESNEGLIKRVADANSLTGKELAQLISDHGGLAKFAESNDQPMVRILSLVNGRSSIQRQALRRALKLIEMLREKSLNSDMTRNGFRHALNNSWWSVPENWYQSREFLEALKKCEPLLEGYYPNHFRVVSNTLAGEEAERKGDIEKALNYFSTVTSDNPRAAEKFFVRQFEKLIALNDPRQADQNRQLFQSMVHRPRKRAKLDRLIGWALWNRKKFPVSVQLNILSVAAQFPSKTWLSLRMDRGSLGSETRNTEIKDILGRDIKTFRQLHDRLQTEVYAKGVSMDGLRRPLFELLMANPSWIQSQADIDLVLQTEHVWPEFSRYSGDTQKLTQLLFQNYEKIRRQFPDSWRYDPGSSDQLQGLLVQKMKEWGTFPADSTGKFALWSRLSARGITSSSDSLLREILIDPTNRMRSALHNIGALTGGRIFDGELRARLSQDLLDDSKQLRELMRAPRDRRHPQLEATVELVKTLFPERGMYYERALEALSWQIKSTEQESAFIHRAKAPEVGGDEQEEVGVRTLSAILDTAHKWPKHQQWQLIRFLRGEIEPNKFFFHQFREVGPMRIQYIFQNLPMMARAALLDPFLDSDDGLLGKVNVRNPTGWTRSIINHLLKNGKPDSRKAAFQILDSFLYALDKTGNGASRSRVLGYLLAQPHKEDTKVGEVLKNVLEAFGTTGIKIGQFIVASEILPEEDNEFLRKLQENARERNREGVYSELRKILGATKLPLELGDLKGSASIKYALEGKFTENDAEVILKVLREEAVEHTAMEFKILDEMADYLRQQYGPKFGVFRSIVKASQKAIERELVFKDEVDRGKLAKEHLYADKSEPGAEVRVPEDFLLSNRLIAARYARGESIHALKPGDAEKAADKILRMEGDNMLADVEQTKLGATFGEDEIPDAEKSVVVEPDRHPGNYRIDAAVGEIANLIIHPIDFGQLFAMTIREKNEVMELFSLAQVLGKSGSTQFGAEEIARILGFEARDIPKIRAALKRYFPSERSPVASYYDLLAALEDAGKGRDIPFFDFIRGITQFRQYEKFSPDTHSPLARFAENISQRVERITPQVELTPSEKIVYGCREFLGKMRRRQKAQ